MFKGFQNTSRNNGFNGFPAVSFRMNENVYGQNSCIFWLDSTYGLNTGTDLAAVSNWQSKIGQVTFTQATAANQPRYVAANANFNNYPTVEFFDSVRIMTSSNAVPINATTSTMVIVAKYTTATSINTVIGSQNNYGAFTLGGSFTGYNGCGMTDTGGGNNKTGTTETTATKIFIATDTSITVNNVEEATFSSFPFTYTLNQLGRMFTLFNYGLSGHIAEILVYDKKLSATQISNLSTQLNDKYVVY